MKRSIERISLSNFNGFATSVEQALLSISTSTSTVAASSAARSFDGNVVSFGYAPGTATGAIVPSAVPEPASLVAMLRRRRRESRSL